MTVVIHERPKMPRATWEALRNHIIRERQNKKKKEEKNEEYERLKKERENKKKQEASSLEETKEQIGQLEQKLTNLKEEKHQFFLTLKKVLNEDDTRRRKETSEMNNIMGYTQSTPIMPLAGHAQQHHMYLQPTTRQPNLYLKGPHIVASLPPAPPIKRQRSPSPPRPPAVSSAYYRTTPLPTPGRMSSSVYGHPSASASGAPIYAMSSGVHYPFPTSGAAAVRDEDRKQVYLSHPAAGRFSIHQQIEQANQKTGFPTDRERARLGLPPAPAAHSQPVALTASRAGSITAGYPHREASAAYQAAPHTMVSTVAPSLPPRLAYSQAAAAAAAASQAQESRPRYYPGGLHREV
jgi:G protein pathway suppressor 2